MSCESEYAVASDGTCKYNLGSISSTASAFADGFGASVVVFSLISSIVNLSAPLEIWITIHQIQLIVLLLTSTAYFPTVLKQYFDQLKLFSFIFTLIDFKKTSILKEVLNYFDYDVEYQKLKHFDVESGSTFVNVFSILFIFAIVSVIH